MPATTALGSFAVGATAAATATAPILFGNNIQRQEDEVAAGKKASVDVGDALIATFGQATLEGIADKILLGGAFRSLGKSIFTRTASRVGSGATTEGLTEVGQQMMERAQVGYRLIAKTLLQSTAKQLLQEVSSVAAHGLQSDHSVSVTQKPPKLLNRRYAPWPGRRR